MADQRIDGTLTAEHLRSILDYDPETGIFTWRSNPQRAKNWNTRRSGKPAGGSDCQYGYISIRIGHALYQAHRLAWLYMTGEWPISMVDHIDVDPTNNRWSNLRAATKAENMRNLPTPKHNTSGLKGATKVGRNRWVAQIQHNGKNNYLGTFATAEEAHEAYCRKAKELFGEYARFA